MFKKLLLALLILSVFVSAQEYQKNRIIIKVKPYAPKIREKENKTPEMVRLMENFLK